MAKRLAKELPELIPFMQASAPELMDPTYSKCCPDCLHTLSNVLLGDDSVAAAACQPVCHGFWDACIVAVTTPRTAEELAAVRKVLRANALRCSRKLKFHRIDPRAEDADIDDPLHLFFHALYQCLATCIAPSPGRSSSLFSNSGPKKTFGTKNSRWPLHPNDLVPLGARQSVEMHLHWCCLLFSPAMLAYIQTVIVGCRSLVFPHVLESPLRERLVWYIVQMLDTGSAQHKSSWPTTVPYVRPARPALWLRESSRSIIYAVGFIKLICDGPDANGDDILKLCAGFEPVLLPLLGQALDAIQRDPTADKSAIGRTVNGLCMLACRLHRQCPQVELHAQAKAWLLDLTRANQSSLAPLKGMLTRRYYRRTCSGPSCTNGVTETGKPLQLCSVCKFTQYCCKACQKADWKRAAVPHKDLCPVLCSLRPVLEKDTSEFEDVLLDLDWYEPDKKQMILWLKD